jgi:hypothetical protein
MIGNEMHSGFFALRSQMPMNCRATNRKVKLTNETKVISAEEVGIK